MHTSLDQMKRDNKSPAGVCRLGGNVLAIAVERVHVISTDHLGTGAAYMVSLRNLRLRYMKILEIE